MKKQIILSVSMMMMTIVTLAGYSPGKKNQPKEELRSSNAITETATRNWSVDENFNAIVVKGKLEIILVPEVSTNVKIEGREDLVNQVYLKIEDGVLKIQGRKTFTKQRTTVFIPVQDLEKVILRDDANLSSKGRITAKKLKIRIEGTSVVNVKSLGEIEVDSDNLHDFYVEKSERSIVRIEKA